MNSSAKQGPHSIKMWRDVIIERCTGLLLVLLIYYRHEILIKKLIISKLYIKREKTMEVPKFNAVNLVPLNHNRKNYSHTT